MAHLVSLACTLVACLMIASTARADVGKPPDLEALYQDAKANPKDKAKLKAYLVPAAEELRRLSAANHTEGVLGMAARMEEIHHGIFSVHYCRGLAYLTKKLYSQASSDLEQARAIANKQKKPAPEVDLALGKARFGDKEFDAAVRSLVAYETHGGKMDEEIYLLLITAADHGGQQQRAIDTLKLATTQYPANQDFQRLAKRYEKVLKVASRETDMMESGTLHFSTKYEIKGDVSKVRQVVERCLEAAYDKVTQQLGAYPVTTVPVVVYASLESYHKNTDTPSWMGGHYNRLDGQIRLGESVIRIGERELTATICHELTHRILDEITQHNIPSWLTEGLAQISEGRSMEGSEIMITEMLSRYDGKLPPLQMFAGNMTANNKMDPKIGYALAWGATRFLIAKIGESGMQQALRKLGKGATVEAAFGMTYEELQQEWVAAEAAATGN